MSSDGPGQGTITSRPVLPPPPLAFGRWRSAWRLAGLVAGFGAVVAMGPTLRPAPGPPPLPLLINAGLTRAGEVGVVGGTTLLAGAPVTAAAEAVRGEQVVTSQTWAPVALTVKDNGPAIGVEEQILLRVALDDTVIFEGTRAQLRAARSDAVRLDPRQHARLSLEVSVTGTDSNYHGRTADIRLDIDAERVED